MTLSLKSPQQARKDLKVQVSDCVPPEKTDNISLDRCRERDAPGTAGGTPVLRSNRTEWNSEIAGLQSCMKLNIVRATVFVVAFCALCSAQSQVAANAAELQLFAAVNRARKAQGLAALRWDDALTTAARRHSRLMAQHGTAEHGFAGEPGLASRVTQAGAHFVWLAENVGLGTGVDAIQAEFLKSANHRANILDSDMDSIGVGVVEHGGQWFAVEDFSKAK